MSARTGVQLAGMARLAARRQKTRELSLLQAPAATKVGAVKHDEKHVCVIHGCQRFPADPKTNWSSQLIVFNYKPSARVDA